MALDMHVGVVGHARIAALVGGDGLVALAAEPIDRPDLSGAVYRAKIIRRDATAGFTIVDLGDREAMLPGASPSTAIFLVQVRRAARDGKRPEATTDIILPGRFLMAAPTLSDVKTSSRLRNAKTQRDRAVRLGLTAGWILRQSFAEASDADIDADAQRLSALVQRLADGGVPGPVLPPHPVWSRVVLDEGAPAQVYAPADLALAVRADLRALGLDPPFAGDPCDLEELTAPLRTPEVALPRGGRLTIEPTRALIAIDVDAGAAGAEAANTAAVDAVARQLRLRNIGGIVVIDLVSQRSDWRPVIDRFRRALAEDPARTTIAGGVSPLGLLQLSRERRGLSLAEALDESPRVVETSPNG
ncbi:MAG: ribonuclease E/G [Pseudomonadota bacterium]